MNIFRIRLCVVSICLVIMVLVGSIALNGHWSSRIANGMAYPYENWANDIIAQVNQLSVEGEMQSVFAGQLIYRIQIIELLMQQEVWDEVAAYIEDFLAYIHEPSVQLQGLISEHAANQLAVEANELLHVLNDSESDEELLVVLDGQAQAVVIIPNPPHPAEAEAAGLLTEYIQRSTGATLPIFTVTEWAQEVGESDEVARIYVGISAEAAEDDLETAMLGMDRDGFLIYPYENSVTIIGPSRWGTLNGVTAFLERYVDVRWLMPGPDGEDVLAKSDIVVPMEEIREEPVFMQRMISPLSGDPYDASQPPVRQAYYEWSQRNRLQGNYNRIINYHHSMYSLFSVNVFGAMHPEFYPRGIPPAPNVTTGWQPCFSEPGTVQVAADRIIQYFQANPLQTSYSLGVNDSRGFCEADPNHPAYPNRANSLGMADLSDIYYGWVNQVVELVTQVYPDKWFGLLAYQEVADPPSFPLHSRVVPFLTKDRMTWLDAGVRSAEQARMHQWSQAASQLGWYDYMYGSVYAVPRIYMQPMGDNYRYAWSAGVAAHYTEMYPGGSDWPKAWVSARLQWDPEQDVDVLLQEWYERAVGTVAAPYLKAYYDWWEQFWTVRVPDSPWFENGKQRAFLPFTSGEYMDLLTEAEIAQCRTWMEAVVAHAGSGAQQIRAEKLFQAFQLAEASALTYPKRGEPLATAAKAIDLLNHTASTIDDKLALAAARIQWINDFQNDPVLSLPMEPSVESSGWNKYDFWHLVDYMNNNEPAGGPVTEEVAFWIDQETHVAMRDFARLLQQAATSSTPLVVNPSFEAGGASPSQWNQWIVASGTMRRSQDIAHSGISSMKIEALQRGGPHQTFAVQPGLIAARVYYYVPAGNLTEGTIQLAMNIRGATNTNLAIVRSEVRSLADADGEWLAISLLEQVPAQVGGTAVERIQFIITIDGLSDGEAVFIDDATVWQFHTS